VADSACVHIKSGDISIAVAAQGHGSPVSDGHGCSGNIKRGESPIGSAHEAVVGINGVRVYSRDIVRRVDAEREGSLILCRACTGSIEGGKRACGGRADEAVSEVGCGSIGRGNVDSRDIARRVDAQAGSSLKHGRASGRNLKFGEGGPATLRVDTL